MTMSYAAAVVSKLSFFGSSSSHRNPRDDSSVSQTHDSNVDRTLPDERLGAPSLQDSRKTEPISRGGIQEPETVVSDLKANIGKQETDNEIRRLSSEISRRDVRYKELEKQRTRDLETFKSQEIGRKGELVKRDVMLRQANETAELLRADLKARDMEIYELRKSHEIVTKQRQELDILSKTQANELMTLRKESDHHRRLLDIRALELKGAQTFLGKTDTISGQDVITLMDALNSEILQTAALMGENFELYERNRELSPEANEATLRINNILGAQTVRLLLEKRGEDEAMLLQIAFQCALVELCRLTIESWSFLVHPPTDQIFQAIYVAMQEQEVQSVFGRWRALTRFYVHQVMDQESPSDPPALSHSIQKYVYALADILVATGRKASCFQAAEVVDSQFRERLSAIAQRAIQLNSSLGVNMTSADVHPITHPYNTPFDPDWMEDAYGKYQERKTRREDVVLGTTDLGIFRWDKSLSGEFSRVLLSKPKVVLLSTVVEPRGQ